MCSLDPEYIPRADAARKRNIGWISKECPGNALPAP